MAVQLGTVVLILASLNLSLLVIPLIWCHPPASARNIFNPVIAVCPDDGFESLSKCRECSEIKTIFFVVFILILPITLLLVALYLQQYKSRRRLKKASREHLRGNAGNIERRSGRHTTEPDLERAADIELSDWTTYEDSITTPRWTQPISVRYHIDTAEPNRERSRTIELSDWETIRAPPPAHSTRPRVEQTQITPSRNTTSIRCYSVPLLPAYKSTETLPIYRTPRSPTTASLRSPPVRVPTGANVITPLFSWAWGVLVDFVRPITSTGRMDNSV